jgi:hypothetical protein
MAGVGTGMSVDTPGTSRVIIGDRPSGVLALNSNHQQAPTGESALCCGPFWVCVPHPSLLRPLGSLKPQAQSG